MFMAVSSRYYAINIDIALEKKALVFRLPAYSLDGLKEHAAIDHRSLNNYVEAILHNAVYHEPNELTKSALEEAKADDDAGF